MLLLPQLTRLRGGKNKETPKLIKVEKEESLYLQRCERNVCVI